MPLQELYDIPTNLVIYYKPRYAALVCASYPGLLHVHVANGSKRRAMTSKYLKDVHKLTIQANKLVPRRHLPERVKESLDHDLELRRVESEPQSPVVPGSERPVASASQEKLPSSNVDVVKEKPVISLRLHLGFKSAIEAERACDALGPPRECNRLTKAVLDDADWTLRQNRLWLTEQGSSSRLRKCLLDLGFLVGSLDFHSKSSVHSHLKKLGVEKLTLKEQLIGFRLEYCKGLDLDVIELADEKRHIVLRVKLDSSMSEEEQSELEDYLSRLPSLEDMIEVNSKVGEMLLSDPDETSSFSWEKWLPKAVHFEDTPTLLRETFLQAENRILTSMKTVHVDEVPRPKEDAKLLKLRTRLREDTEGLAVKYPEMYALGREGKPPMLFASLSDLRAEINASNEPHVVRLLSHRSAAFHFTKLRQTTSSGGQQPGVEQRSMGPCPGVDMGPWPGVDLHNRGPCSGVDIGPWPGVDRRTAAISDEEAVVC